MAKGTRGRRRIASRQCRPTPYPLPSYKEKEDTCSKAIKKDWEDATCSVCMECPHNAVLLLCSSHDKGCRPYMCGTSFRYSNCLDQYKKAYAKATPPDSHPVHDSLDSQVIGPFSGQSADNGDTAELACPLCRGQVKGWTVVEPAREQLNAKKRSCMQENCTFMGTFKELRKHVRADHPSAKPREVDPTLEQKWRRMEREREREDVMSTIRSSMPGAVFFGDYVIEGGHYEFDSDEEEGFDINAMERNEGMEVGVNRNLMSMFLFLQAFGSAGNVGSNRGARRQERDSTNGGALDRGSMRLHRDNPIDDLEFSDQDSENDDDVGNENDGNGGTSLVGRLRRQGRVLLGRSGRRRRNREVNQGMR
ncbi:uncharacterized protein LOC131019381 [Salvia miltiorrhiza]|uniref:uncharacterized protein LOC131019362 n=1 Tax=Salvia miltiorrhiza TaxID=226208 RepID=UPI0025AC03B9|nr:uncharacterized protein LOC131019362 [Salvia miltiorrhiza]XP_057803876.1 uncharacterized protein LOC131019362 [Salvia miltiorrhiza]XP_057803905.1 uncharacterized protein LOC131019381 [Salvia miltiorrhiza]XP_057803906.1 uncharacterized protein LOC131019381 [Salvia miltiorrhiza]